MRRVSSLIRAIFALAFVCLSGCAARHAPVSSAALPLSPWDSRDALVFPFEYDFARENSPMIWLSLNGGKPCRFDVDTGSAPALTVWEDAVDRLQIKPQNKWRMRGGGTASDFQVVSVSLPCLPAKRNAENAFHLSSVEGAIVKSPYAAWKPDPLRPVGLIGNALLRHLGHAIRFDFVKCAMTAYRRMETPAPASGATTVPVHKLDDVYAVNVPLPDGGVQEMLIDTGCEGHVYIPQRLARRFHTAEWAEDGGTFRDATGEHGAIESVMPTLKVGDFTERNVLTTQGQAGDNFALLGINYLSRFRVTLDYAHNELTLERASDYKRHLYQP